MRILDTLTIWMNRARCVFGKRRYAPENILLLLPHCLQYHECRELVKNDLLECKSCGRCKLKDIRALVERTGIQSLVASGGRIAQKRAMAPEVRVVLAVACKRELAEGVRAVFPKKVFAVPNSWPHGECYDTDVDVERLEKELRRLLQPAAEEDTP